MRLLTVFGTRPEIIRLSLVIPLLDAACEHTLVHTGQNFDPELSDVFFEDLQIRAPDAHLGAHRPGFAAQAGAIIESVDAVLEQKKPDRLLILGDTDSGLSAIPAARRGIPVFHLEAGNRCYDPRVPEEVNRRLIDHASTVLMPYTFRSKENLLREGFPRQRIFVVGNPIAEVLEHFAPRIAASRALEELGLEKGRYLLVTLHRAENVDLPDRLTRLLDGITATARALDVPAIVSVHPRTRERMERFGIDQARERVRFVKPLRLFDFVALEQSARLVMTDSGTVQEECCIFGVPNVTLRDTSERMETVECGSNLLTGADPDAIVAGARLADALGAGWSAPPEYVTRHVSRTIARVVLGPVHASLPV